LCALQLKVICMLKHQEIGNLFAVCKELRGTVRIFKCNALWILPVRSSCSATNVAPAICFYNCCILAQVRGVGPISSLRAHAVTSLIPLFPLQMDTAMLLHFNVLTPSHHDVAGASGRCLPPRPAKRGGSPTPSTGPAGSNGSADWYASLKPLSTQS